MSSPRISRNRGQWAGVGCGNARMRNSLPREDNLVSVPAAATDSSKRSRWPHPNKSDVPGRSHLVRCMKFGVLRACIRADGQQSKKAKLTQITPIRARSTRKGSDGASRKTKQGACAKRHDSIPCNLSRMLASLGVAAGADRRQRVNASAIICWQHRKGRFLRRYRQMHADARR